MPCIPRKYQDIDDLVFEVDYGNYSQPSSQPSTSERPSPASSGAPIASTTWPSTTQNYPHPSSQPSTSKRPSPASSGTPIATASTTWPSTTPKDGKLIARYDNKFKAPMCAILCSVCSSGDLLVGSGIFDGDHREIHAPNIIDDCEGDSAALSSATVQQAYEKDESVETVIVRSIDKKEMQVGNEVEVEVKVWPAKNTAQRSNPGKASVAHLYYARKIEANNVTWNYVWSDIVDPAQETHTFTTRINLESDVSLSPGSAPLTIAQAVRVSYSYGQYKPSPCPENAIWQDIDDLIFVVALIPPASSPTASPTASSCNPQYIVIWAARLLSMCVGLIISI